MDFEFTEEQEKLRNEAREYFFNEMPEDFEPDYEVMFSLTKEQTDFWMEFQKKAGAKGYLTPGWSKETGGLGLSPIEQGIVEEEWGYTGGRWPNFSGLHIAGPAVQVFGSEEQKKKLTEFQRLIDSKDVFELPGDNDVHILPSRIPSTDTQYRLKMRRVLRALLDACSCR